MWVMLSEHARLFAVDLPGFGASERRDKLPAPRAMGASLARIVTEVGLDRPHVVAPDVGTAAGLFAAADNQGPFASLTVGAGGANPDRTWRAAGLPDDVRADYLDCY
jgi:pimeloyl-ACP methyl ester carboxylesterase